MTLQMTARTCERKLDFLVVGAQKAGTTALYRYLRTHPELDLPLAKELHFFDNDDRFVSADPDYNSYQAQVPCRSPESVRGEITPIYMYWRPCMSRVWRYNAKIRIIVLLRDPVERAFSQWRMERHRGHDSTPFFDSLLREHDRVTCSAMQQHRVLSYVDRGRYCEQLRRVWRFFPPEQVLIVKTETLREGPAHCLRRVCSFLGVDEKFFDDALPVVNLAEAAEPMDPRARQWLGRVFEQEISELQDLLGWNLSSWAREAVI